MKVLLYKNNASPLASKNHKCYNNIYYVLSEGLKF